MPVNVVFLLLFTATFAAYSTLFLRNRSEGKKFPITLLIIGWSVSMLQLSTMLTTGCSILCNTHHSHELTHGMGMQSERHPDRNRRANLSVRRNRLPLRRESVLCTTSSSRTASALWLVETVLATASNSHRDHDSNTNLPHRSHRCAILYFEAYELEGHHSDTEIWNNLDGILRSHAVYHGWLVCSSSTTSSYTDDEDNR